MRALKIIGYGLGAIIALLVIFAIAVWLFVNPNDFKGRIIASVRSATGRELLLPGDIKLSVFPWAALELGPASLGSPPEFAGAPFVSVQHVALSVRLLPLLHKRLDVGRIDITGLDVQLSRDAAGHGNWQLPSSAQSPAPAASAASNAALPELAGLTIKDSHLSYQGMVADKLRIDIGPVQSTDPIAASASLQLQTSAGATPVPVSVKFPFRFDPAAQALEIAGLSVQVAAARLNGSISGTRVIDAPELHGRFSLEPISPRDLMKTLDITPPATRDPKVLSNLVMSGAFALAHNALHLTDLVVQLDDSLLKGSVSVDDLDSSAISFDLALDQIDLDRYGAADAAAGGHVAAAAAVSAAKPTEFPTDSLKRLNLHGNARVARARISGIALTNLTVGLQAKDAVIHVAPIEATLYGGSCQGELTLDGHAAVPSLKLQQSLSNVDIAQLLNDFAKTQRLSGRGELTLNLTANGRDSDAMLKSIGGRVTANLAGGAVEGIDLWYQINRALSLIKKQAAAVGSDSGRTKFDVFKASADIAHAVATTKDLSINSGNLRVTGQGWANLLTKAIDYRVHASILKSAPAGAGAPGATLADVPMLITGSLNNPNVRPDLPGMAKAGMQQQLDQHKDELKHKLQDQLKGLLGK